MVPERKTVDGFEEHFGLNYLGHFLLTQLLLDTLTESGRPGRTARVVTMSSATHYVGELNLDDLQGRWVRSRGPGVRARMRVCVPPSSQSPVGTRAPVRRAHAPCRPQQPSPSIGGNDGCLLTAGGSVVPRRGASIRPGNAFREIVILISCMTKHKPMFARFLVFYLQIRRGSSQRQTPAPGTGRQSSKN